VGTLFRNLKQGPEDKVEFACLGYLKILTLQNKLPAVWFKVTNEGAYNKGGNRPLYGRKLDSQGKIAGISDAVIAGNGQTLFCEFKAGKNKQSPSQKIFEEWAQETGNLYYLVYSLDEFKEIIFKHFGVKD